MIKEVLQQSTNQLNDVVQIKEDSAIYRLRTLSMKEETGACQFLKCQYTGMLI